MLTELDTADCAFPGDAFTSIAGLKGRYEDSDNVVTSFYVPLLTNAVKYDRVSGYFTSGSLALLARGLSAFVHRPDATVRLIVGGQLADNDVEAIEHGADLITQVNARILESDFWEDLSEANDLRRGLLAWLLANGRLEMKVGLLAHQGKPVPQTETSRYFHHKFGVFEDDAGHRVAFDGSNNETVHGLGDHGNGESFSVFRSWRTEGWDDNGEPIVAQFDRFWNASGPIAGTWVIVPIDDAVEQKLLQLAPPVMPDAAWLDEFDEDDVVGAPEAENEPDQIAVTDNPSPGVNESELAELLALRDAPTTGRFTAALSATATPFPHQSATIERAVNTFPRSYLYGDEVGLGKTVELGLTLRELLLAGTIERALILPPAAVITQWQDELSDLMNLDVPRWENGQWIYADGTSLPAAPGDPWSSDKPVVLVTSHLARRSEHLDRICAQKWDVVIVDEAHHARRREGKATGTPNHLLRLLQGMRDADSYQALYLASATPMQMYPHEAWDLIELFGLPDAWAESPDPFTKYFTYIGADWTSRTLPYVATLVQAHFSDNDVVEHPSVNEMVMAKAKELPANQKALLSRGGKVDLRRKFVPGGGSHGPLAQIRTAFDIELDTQALVGAWLQANNPMRDRVFRNTRQTLRAYRDQGLWPAEATIPNRHPVDVIKRMTKAEEDLYCRVQQYILTKYDQAAQLGGKEQNALGFILTVYRRRLTSSFHAIAESLRRRVEGLEDEDLRTGRLFDADDTIEEGAADHAEIDSAIKAAATDDELVILRQLVSDLSEHAAGDESKMFWLRESLKSAFETHGLTSALIFTQYADTMHYIRDRLNATYSGRVIGYSSSGGTLWDPVANVWQELSKDEVKERFRSDEPHILVGTDTLAEGLNLQTCGWLVNWDMPWNFTRVEQRIGRIDRISGHENVYITNFFYDQTVEAKVYKKLRDTIGGFDAIVGISQPVLEDLADVVGGAVGLDDICDDAERASQLQGALVIPDGPALDVSVANLVDAAQDAAAAALAQLDADPATATQLGSIAGWTAAVPLSDLEHALTSSSLTAHLFGPGPLDGSYELRLGDSTHLVTFDRVLARERSPRIQLLTWGTPVLDGLFDSLPEWRAENYTYRELLDMPERSVEVESHISV